METVVTVLSIVASLKGAVCQFPFLVDRGGVNGFNGMGGMDFMNPFGGYMGSADPFGMGIAAAPGPVVDPVAAREAHMTTAEERLGELLTETGANDQARQRVERMLRRSRGQLTGEAAPLNYLVQEFYMTTPGPIPPPNPQPSRQHQNNNYATWGRGNQNGTPQGLGGSSIRRVRGPVESGNGLSNQRVGPNLLERGMQGVGQSSQSSGGWFNGPSPSGGAPPFRRQSRRRNRGRLQGNRPTTAAPPDWEQWLFNTQTKKPQPPANRQPNRGQRVSPNQQVNGLRRSPPPYTRNQQNRGSASFRGPQKSASPALQKPTKQRNPAHSASRIPSKTVPAPAPPKRTSIAVERLKNIQQRIDNLLNSQGGSGSSATRQQLAALRQIRDILSGKKIKRPSIGGSSSPASKSKVKSALPPLQSNPPYDTSTGNQRPSNRKPPTNPAVYNNVGSQRQPNNAGTTAVDFSPFGKVPGDMRNSSGRGVGQRQPSGPPYDNKQGPGQHGSSGQPRQRQQNFLDYGTNNQGAGQGAGSGGRPQGGGPLTTTVIPKLGDVRYIGMDKYVFTDADGFDTFQWIKATPGPPQEQQAQQQQQNQQQNQTPQNQRGHAPA